MKAGDVYESPSGLGFTVTKVLKNAIHVKVDRVYRKNDRQVVVENERIIPTPLFPVFAQAYTKVEKK